MDSKLHPAITVTNIKTFVPVTLEMESAQYTTWSELFTIHCKAFLVYDHLTSATPPVQTSSSGKDSADPKAATPPTTDSWERLDSIVLQWIYGTISLDLLSTILKKNTTAFAAWKALADMFTDNKSSRAIHLKNRFATTRLENFLNMNVYCQELKVIADQLANVDAPVEDDDLVIQLITGLNEQYEGIGMFLQNMEPLPSFYAARSRLMREETRKNLQAAAAAITAGRALHTTTNKPDTSSNNSNEYRSDFSDRGRGRGGRFRGGRGRGRNSLSRGRGAYNNNYGTGGNHYTPNWVHAPAPTWFAQQNQQPFQPPPQYWPNPPCPYPTTPTPRPNIYHNNHSGAGVLGSQPNQAHMAAYTPTNIEQALYTMSLNPPDQWLMDTEATSHMTNNPGFQDPDPYPSMQQQR